jgi:hypothetical protein
VVNLGDVLIHTEVTSAIHGPHGRYKLQTASADSTNYALSVSCIAYRAPDRVNSETKSLFIDADPIPNRPQEFIARDDSITVLDEIDQQIKRSRLEGNDPSATEDEPLALRQRIVAETKHRSVNPAHRISISRPRGGP